MGTTVRTSKPEPLLRSLDPAGLIVSMWSRRELIRTFTVRELTARHRASRLGFAWTVITPTLQMLVYTFVFSAVLNVRLSDRQPDGNVHVQYAVLLFAGLSAFGLFSETVGRAPGMVAGRRNLVKKVRFPLDILPLTSTICALYAACIGLVLAFVAHLVLGGQLSWRAIYLPLVLAPAFLTALGIAWYLSALGVYFRDLQQLISGVVQRLLFFLTPIIYPIERVPESIRPILYLNPMTPVVDSARRCLLMDRDPAWLALGIWAAIGIILCVTGHAFFQRARRGFADVL